MGKWTPYLGSNWIIGASGPGSYCGARAEQRLANVLRWSAQSILVRLPRSQLIARFQTTCW
jgi:hypothetical protein